MAASRGRASGASVKLAAALCFALMACGTGQPAVPHAAALSAGQEPAGELSGEWVEYWARSGHVETDTQRYVFGEDGRFTWFAPSDPAHRLSAARKAGRFVIEGEGAVRALVLRVEAEEFAGCAKGCQARAPQVAEHQPGIVERLELGECARNEEAQALDGRYACVAIGGRAFWRRP